MATVSVPVPIGLVQPLLDKLDGLKAKFLAVPANARAALDRLARIRVEINRQGTVPVEINQAAMAVENNLKRVQSEWQTAAERFTMLDEMRRSNQLLTMDGLQLASSLVLSAGCVLANSDKSIRAVDDFARKYLTPEQQNTLNTQTAGVGGGISPMLLLYAAVGYYFLRRRR